MAESSAPCCKTCEWLSRDVQFEEWDCEHPERPKGKSTATPREPEAPLWCPLRTATTGAAKSDEALRRRLKGKGREVHASAGVATLPAGEVPDGGDTARRRGMHDCYQDRCENIPFASVGGLEQRSDMQAPEYIKVGEVGDYLDGYRAMAEALYGADWATCPFSWQPTLSIE